MWKKIANFILEINSSASRPQDDLKTQPHRITKFAPPAALSRGSDNRSPAPRALGFGPPRGCEFAFSHPPQFAKSDPTQKVSICKKAPPSIFCLMKRILLWAKKIYHFIPFYTILCWRVFCKLRGGCENANSHPLRGTKSPRAPRGRATG